MVVKTYTPSIAEVLTKVNNAKTKDKKIAILKENDSEALRAIIKSSFDPNIQWVMPEGDVPYKPMKFQKERNILDSIKSIDNYTNLSKVQMQRPHNLEKNKCLFNIRVYMKTIAKVVSCKR